MDIISEILFFFAGLGVFNAVLLAGFFLFFIKPRRTLNLIFGCLILMLCIRIGKSLFHVFMEVPRTIRQIGLSACILVGPLLFLYLKGLSAKAEGLGNKEALHVLLPFLGILVFGIARPYEHFDQLWNEVVVQVIYLVWIAYVLASLQYILPLFQAEKRKSWTAIEKWMLLVYGCVFWLCLAYNLALHGAPYLAGPFSFSIILYVLCIYLIPTKTRTQIIHGISEKYKKQKLEHTQAETLINALQQLMKEQNLYLQADLKMPQVAEAISSSPHDLSQALNGFLGLSFNEYINQWRIEKACELLQTQHHLSIEGIGKEVGFNSRSAFYTAFKNTKGITPGEFKKQKAVFVSK